MELKIRELIEFLKEIGINDLNKNDKKYLIQLIQDKKEIEYVKQDLELLLSLNRVLISSYGFVSLSNMRKINEEIDSNTYNSLFLVYQSIKNKSKDKISCLREFKGVVSKILNSNTKVNKIVEKNVKDSFDKVELIRDSLYFTMEDKQKADKLLDNCMKRLKQFVNQCEVANLEEIIQHLKSNYDLTDSELVSVSRKCATFFTMSNVSKIDNISKVIDDFKKFIEDKLLLEEKESKVEKLLNKDFKDILLNSSTIMTKNTESVEETVKFLMGYKFGEIRVGAGKGIANIKGDFSPRDLAKIYNESITSLSIGIDKIKDVCIGLAISYKSCFKDNLDVNNLINGKNFTSLAQLGKDDYDIDGKMDEIFAVLSMFITKEDMVNLLKKDFSFLIAPVSAVKSSLSKAVLESKNNNDLRRNVLQKIRNHFDIYEGGYYNNGDRKQSVSASNVSKVNVKNVNEEDVVNILKKLDVTSNDIDCWVKEWNKEEKELKNMEIEIGLEELLEELEVIDEFANSNIVNVDEFMDNTLVNKNLLIEVKDKYMKIITEEKLNKQLLNLSDKVAEKINEVSNKIEDNISRVITIYDEVLKDSNKKLEVLIADKEAYYFGVSEAKRREKDALDNNITPQRLHDAKKQYDSIISRVKKIKREYAGMKKEREGITALLGELYEIIDKEKKDENVTRALNKDDFMKIENKISNKSEYVTLAFIKSLEVEGLIPFNDDDRIEIEKLTYKQFKCKYLKNEDSVKIADKIYNKYLSLFKRRNELREELIRYYKTRTNIKSKVIHGMEEACDELVEKLKEMKRNVEYGFTMLEETEKIKKIVEGVDINSIEQSINELNEYIKVISLKREKVLNNKK